MLTTQTQDLTSTQTSTPQEVAPHLDAAAQWATTIEAIEQYMRECEAKDRADEVERRRRAAEVERSLDDLARECRRLDQEAAAKPTKKKG